MGTAACQPGEMAASHRGRKITLAVLIVLLAGGVGAWWAFFQNRQKPVDVNKVVRNFEPGRPDGGAGNREPTPGVYLYATKGNESISALGGQTNTYPATTTLTVVDTPCGVDTRWEILTNRSDLEHHCRDRHGTWTKAGSETSDRFFNQTQVDLATCKHVVELVASPKPGTAKTGRCTSGSSYFDVTYTVVGTGSITIGGTKVAAVHRRVTSTQGGERSGGGTKDQWVQTGTNLVLRSRVHDDVRSPSPIGSVTYKQDYEITMKSLTPKH